MKKTSETNKITKAFKSLRKLGYFARQNFWCCQSCGWSAVPDGKDDKVVFFHNQDNQQKIQGKPFHLSWSGNGEEICNVLRECDITFEWDGNENKRIKLINY